MDVSNILKRCDHTLLRQDATGEEIMTLCDEGIRYGVASVCIPPCHVAGASRYVKGRIPICTVIGFPNGYSTSRVKAFEAQEAIQNGASEIDMVANLAMIKDACWDDVLEDIKTVRSFTQGHILKVIIETCLLTDDEKRIMCAVVSASGADYIKTSTGFSTGGATREDVQLLRTCCDSRVKVKASGGIASLQDAEDFMALGADRLGTSRLVKLAIEMEKGTAPSATGEKADADEPGQSAAGNA
ncbi:MAG: deoxyribose-phosphate aldolase [Oscillospiraceae bacterium]|nr:deoxyribose-phosphate aldolase [Oscillospiraceae bacterium]